jgi:hypothetical protein
VLLRYTNDTIGKLLLLLLLLKKKKKTLIFSVLMKKKMLKLKESRLNVLPNTTPKRPTSPRLLPRPPSLLKSSLGMMKLIWMP